MTRILRLLLIAAIALPLWQPVAAQNTPSQKLGGQIHDYYNKDVVSGNSTNAYLPIYASRLGRTTCEGQMIYSSTRMGLAEGTEIVGIAFHTNASVANPTNGQTNSITVRVGETSLTSISNHDVMLENRENATNVYTGQLPSGTTTVKFDFSEPYTYNGQNFVIDISKNSGDYAPTVNWYGSNNMGNNVSRYYYSSSNGGYNDNGVNFLPSLTIYYRTPHQGTVSERTIAVKDINFYKEKLYSWKENGTGQEHIDTLHNIAKNPDQIIAMLKAVYTDPTIPGNKKRGFSATGGSDHDDDVAYTGAGTLVRASNGTVSFDDTFGWDIPGNLAVAGGETSGNYSYWYMDPEQYSPEEEGLTLLLLELQDDFTPKDVIEDGKVILPATTFTENLTGYAKLREYFSKTIKSARIITEAVRTGDGLEKGTLFKIDCDKMNKFYLIAKGQLQWFRTSYYSISARPDFCNNPCYVYNSSSNINQYYDPAIDTYFFLGHMFEQFSPSISSSGDAATGARDDIYRDLINMESFGVVHDCPNVPFVSDGHHFMMYGPDSHSADCADVRDMMFFVPDYRMLDWSDRGFNGVGTNQTQDYFRYHRDIQPTMGLYVIHQNPITETTAFTDDYYHLTLTWKTNLDDFLPGEQQEFDLLEVVYNERLGRNEYVPVYYTKIAADGKTVVYYDPETGLEGEDHKTPIKLKLDQAENKIYTDVFVQRQESSFEVTYAIQGWDAEDSEHKHFLSLQRSNQESYIIKGTDPTEILSLVELSHYSRFNVQKEINCYSNRFKLLNNVDGLRNVNITVNETALSFKRKSADGEIEIATATFTGNNELTIEMKNQKPSTDFPYGLTTGPNSYRAGYHANNGGQVTINDAGNETWKISYDVDEDGYIIFKNNEPMILCDNFTASVSDGTHPGRYTYEAYTVNFKHAEGDAFPTGEGHSSLFNVVIYKTDTDINSLTLDNVLEDTNGSSQLEDVEFDVDVQLVSRTEVLRYDAYRWTVGANNWGFIIDKVNGEDNEVDIQPTGQADNQGEYYTVRMNSGSSDEVSGGIVYVENGSGTATFVDKVPIKNNSASEYTYAPVVEAFGRDYFGDERGDYNTYGGPLQTFATGVLDVEVVEPSEAYPLMSTSKWQDGDKWYSYYNILLNFKALNVPVGYELYKVRAWRNVDNTNNILNENTEMFPTRAARISGIDENGWYLYEDINYGDQLTLPENDGSFLTMSMANLKSQNAPKIGERSVSFAKAQNPGDTNAPEPMFADAVEGETRATFGAERLKLSDNDQYGSLDELNAQFKVRAYFTRSDNPLTNKEPGESMPKVLYVIGNGKNVSWSTSNSIGNLYSTDGKVYTGNVEIVAAQNDDGGFFSFTKKLGAGWDDISSNRYGFYSNDNCWIVTGDGDLFGQELHLEKNANPGAYKVPAGTYKLVVDMTNESDMKLVVTPAPANAPRLGEVTGSDFDYYIAEGTIDFSSKDYTIITGIVENLNSSQVVGVTYYNVAGIESDTPFQGVNIVVTRYSDGSTTTTKILK